MAIKTDTAAPGEGRAGIRLAEALLAEEARGQRLAAWVRVVALLVIGLWVFFENAAGAVIYYEAILLLFVLLGFVPVWLRDRGLFAPWQRYVFPVLDFALLTYALIAPNPLEDTWFPDAWRLQFSNEVYFFVLIAGSIATYSPRVVLWSGFAAAATWTAGVLWILSLPESFSVLGGGLDWAALPKYERIAMLTDPNRVDLAALGKQCLLFVLVAGVLATTLYRVRRLIASHAAGERERANLARYFSPNMVDELAQTDKALAAVRGQDAAVLFADITGFTRWAEDRPPEAVIDRLRGFHGRMERAVFAHGGTLDKYLGDGLMATFGTPRGGAHPARDALACARAMVDAVDDWNRTGIAADPLRLRVGLHFGPVTLGDVGGENRLEFAVIGDTVNVASRLVDLAKEVGAPIVASAEVIVAAKGETGATAGELDAFAPGPAQPIRGRADPITIWTCGTAPAA